MVRTLVSCTNVAWFQTPVSTPHVAFSPLLREVFLQVLQFSPLLKNQHFQIQIRIWNARSYLNEFLQDTHETADFSEPKSYYFTLILDCSLFNAKLVDVICRKIPEICPGAYIFRRPFLRGVFLRGTYIRRGLCTEGNLRFKIDWASL